MQELGAGHTSPPLPHTFPAPHAPSRSRATERASLLATHGEDTVILSSANTYSYDKRHRRLKDYLNLEEYMAPRTPDTLANETWLALPPTSGMREG